MSSAARIAAWGKTRNTNLLAPMYKEGSGCKVVADILPGQLCPSQVPRQEVLTLRSLWAVPVLSKRSPSTALGSTQGEQALLWVEHMQEHKGAGAAWGPRCALLYHFTPSSQMASLQEQLESLMEK